MSAQDVLTVLKENGIDQVEEFFDRDEAGIVRVRDRRGIPVEAAIALLQFLPAKVWGSSTARRNSECPGDGLRPAGVRLFVEH